MAPVKKRVTGKPSSTKTKTKHVSTPKLQKRQRVTVGKSAPDPPVASRKRGPLELESKAELDDSGESDSNGAVLKAPALREIDRIVSRSDLKKWSTPSERLQEDIQRILKEAERPVLMTFRKEGPRRDAQRAIQKLIVKLESQLKKAPVPSTTGKDIPLSYEQLLHKTMEYEAILEPTLRHTAELESELVLQKARLAEDESYLKVLQANAKGQEAVRAGQTRTLPRALRTDPQGLAYDSVDNIHISRYSGVTPYDVNGDREMRPIADQLYQHLQSMQTNANALGDVPEFILRGRAAVEEALVQAGPNLRSAVLGV